MQIGTSYLFDSRNRQMAALSGTAAKLQEQIATGKRISTPSEDPVASAMLARLSIKTADQAQYASNVKLAQSLLGQSDTALDTISTNLQRVQELLISAGSDTLNDDNRAAISVELRAILDNLIAVANTTDLRGAPLFGGSGPGPAYSIAGDGSVSFAGEGEAPPIPIGGGVSVRATDSGERIFGNIQAGATTKDMFKLVGDLANALAPGGSASPAARKQALADAGDGLAKLSERITTARASVGARGARVEIESERLAQAGIDDEIERSGIEGTDIQSAVTDLQKTLLALQATQASFSKLSQMSLFDYLR
jgi:flagellar hook-associated protein 3 FlgL